MVWGARGTLYSQNSGISTGCSGQVFVTDLSLSQFESRLHQIKRCQPVGFTSIVTPSRLKKTGHPYAGRVRKVSIGRGMINCIYADSVNRQRLREGLPDNFTCGEPSVGDRVAGTPLACKVTDAGSSVFYLEVFLQDLKSHYFDRETHVELSYFDDIKPYEYATRRNSFRASQGTRKLIRPLCYRLDSLAELRLGGESWAVRPLIKELHSYLIPAQSSDSEIAHQSLESEAVA
jgi:hypothetical protein